MTPKETGIMFLRLVAMVLLLLAIVVKESTIKHLVWINSPDAHIAVAIVMIIALVVDATFGVLLVGAAVVAFMRVNHIAFGSNFFKMVSDATMSRDKLHPPFITETHLHDAQNNRVTESDDEFNKGYKPSGVDFGAQGMDQVSGGDHKLF
jgi:hypothetical protein